MPRTLNPSVAGSSPARPTSENKGLGPLGLPYFPSCAVDGAGTPLPGVGYPPGFVTFYPGAAVPSGAKDKPGTDQLAGGPG
jgi:hypothetical protein